jgi:hypothetical protein
VIRKRIREISEDAKYIIDFRRRESYEFRPRDVYKNHLEELKEACGMEPDAVATTETIRDEKK